MTVEGPKPTSGSAKDDKQTDIEKGVAECALFERCKCDGEDKQDDYETPECNLNIRFSRQVRACKRYFIEADQTELGKN